MYHFVNFKYSLYQSKLVVLYFCNKYELDESRTHLLLSELESLQNSANLTLSEKEIAFISREKYSKRHEQAKKKAKLVILSLVCKQVSPSEQGEDTDLQNLLVLNKETRALLYKRVMKQALLYETNPNKLRRKRVAIWKLLMKVKDDQKDYYALREKVNSSDDLLQDNEGEVYSQRALKS